MKQTNAIYLNDRNILPFSHPLKGCKTEPPDYKPALTKIVSYLGNEILEETARNYLVVASATKYLALVAFLQKDKWPDEKEAEIEERILFSGAIIIHKYNKIPQTNLKAPFFVLSDRIWVSAKSKDFGESLKDLIFSRSRSEKSRQRRMGRIMWGYGNQQAEREASKAGMEAE